MKFVLPFTLLICVCTRPLAQTLPAAEYLRIWAMDGVQQTKEAATLFDDLSNNRDSVKYQQLVSTLERQIDPETSPRRFIRLIMYRALWSMETQKQEKDSVTTHLRHTLRAISMAYPLKDKQLNAELYALYGELSLRIPDLEQSLLYNLRSLEIQEEIGKEHFPKIGFTYFSVSRSCYLTRDYAQSVKYGLKTIDELHRLPRVSRYDRIFLADIIGAAYYRSGQKDSAARYYQQIKTLLKDQDPAHPETEVSWTDFWQGLTDGYLGRIEMEKQHFSTAIPLIRNAIEASIAFNEYGNAASFLNNLAGISYQNRNFTQAAQEYKQAWSLANRAGDQQAIADAALGLSKVYRDLQQPDSSYLYFGRYHVVNDSLTALINRSQLNAARARLDYEKLQESLAKAEAGIRQERNMRKVLVVAIILLIIIASYSWYRIKTKHKRKSALQQQKLRQVQQKEAEARTNLEQFKTRINQKNEEIEALQQQLTQSAQTPQAGLSPSVLLTEEDWVSFRNDFMKAYPGFFPALRKTVKDLTPAQERLTALMKLNFDNAQAAACLGISKDSVARSKRRLRQSLNLPANASLEEYILSI